VEWSLLASLDHSLVSQSQIYTSAQVSPDFERLVHLALDEKVSKPYLVSFCSISQTELPILKAHSISSPP
jgi:hypothetical protein